MKERARARERKDGDRGWRGEGGRKEGREREGREGKDIYILCIQRGSVL